MNLTPSTLTYSDSSQHASTCAPSQCAALADAIPPSTTAHAGHTSTNTSRSNQEAALVFPHNNDSHAHVRTHTAHALTLFNFYGIPLSSGAWLEYYFTTLDSTTSLLTLSAIFTAQCACLGLPISMTVYLHTYSRQ